MIELMITYEWAIVFLGVIAYAVWELVSVRRSQRRTRRGVESERQN